MIRFERYPQYVENVYETASAEERYLSNHRGHLMFVRDEEKPFVTGDLIEQHFHRVPFVKVRTGADPESRCSK